MGPNYAVSLSPKSIQITLLPVPKVNSDTFLPVPKVNSDTFGRGRARGRSCRTSRTSSFRTSRSFFHFFFFVKSTVYPRVTRHTHTQGSSLCERGLCGCVRTAFRLLDLGFRVQGSELFSFRLEPYMVRPQEQARAGPRGLLLGFRV